MDSTDLHKDVHDVVVIDEAVLKAVADLGLSMDEVAEVFTRMARTLAESPDEGHGMTLEELIPEVLREWEEEKNR